MQKQLQLKVMTWNIGGAASPGWFNYNRKIENKVVDKIIEQKADIIIITEFVVTMGVDYLFKQLQDNQYIWFLSSRTGKNGILIVINNNLLVNEVLKKQLYKNNTVASEFDGCNILKVTVPMKAGNELCIVGCRMEIENCDKADFDRRRENFDKILIPHIRPIIEKNLFIVCGDFNNARCLGNLNNEFNRQDYYGKAQCNYNLNIIKDKLNSIGFTMVDVDGNGNPVPTHKGYLPEDHIFVHGLKSMGFKTVLSDNLSDHDILLSKVVID